MSIFCCGIQIQVQRRRRDAPDVVAARQVEIELDSVAAARRRSELALIYNSAGEQPVQPSRVMARELQLGSAPAAAQAQRDEQSRMVKFE